MQLQFGLLDRCVLQRTHANRSDAKFGGTCDAAGDVRVTVRQRGRAVAGFKDRKVGAARRGRFEGVLRALPTGGPYDVRLSIGGETLDVTSVLVGDLWLLGGQSNMEGAGRLSERLAPRPMVRAFYADDRWDAARDPIHNLWASVDVVHNPQAPTPQAVEGEIGGVGPGVAFGHAMFRRTGVPQGLIANAHGGTSMQQWSPALKALGGGSLYGSAIRRVLKAGGRVAGIVWYQGESDAGNEFAMLYTERMRRLIAAFRKDLRDASLPFVLVQLSRVVGYAYHPQWWNAVQEQQRRLPKLIRNTATVPAVDLPLVDQIHIDAAAAHRLGARLADAMSALRNGKRAGPPPIELDRVAKGEKPGDAVVTFRNVVGELRSTGRPWGFDVWREGRPSDAVFDVRLAGNRAIIRTSRGAELDPASIGYGLGTNPYTNITDGADRSLPVFAPLPKVIKRNATGFANRLRVSAMLPGRGDLADLEYPRSVDALGLQPREFVGDFINVNPEVPPPPADALVCFAAAFTCSEAMSLNVLLGYDGPVKVWADGELILHDPAGTNPANIDAKVLPFRARHGRHELLIALGTNGGKAWGIYLRLERTDKRRPLPRWER